MLEDVKKRIKSYNINGNGIPVVAIVEKVVSSRISYIRAETINEAIKAWQDGDEFDYDYVDDERQLTGNVIIVSEDGEVTHANEWCYDDEKPKERPSDDFDL